MKKLSVKSSLKNNRVRYGSFSVLMSVMVIIAFVVVNLLFDQFNVKADLSKNKLFSLSDQSKTIVKNLKGNITIVGMYEAGKEDKTVTEILSKYKSNSSKINVEYKDPVANPQLLQQYTKDGKSIGLNSIIVECGSKYKVIASSELTSTSDNSADDTSGVSSSATFLTVEQKVTSAIMFVSSVKNPVVYELMGHSETVPSTTIESEISNQNYTSKEVNLLQDTEWKPEPGDMLFVYYPQTDMNEKEKATIKDFLSKGGKALFIMGYTKQDLTNFNDVLLAYGVSLQRTIINEPDSGYRYSTYMNTLLPSYGTHDITTPLIAARTPVIMHASMPIKDAKIKKSSVTITPLLSTSNKAWAKKDMSSESTEKTANDYPGPFNIGVAITDKLDKVNDDNNTKLVVVSSGRILDSDMLAISSGGNTMFINSLNWLQNQKNNATIAPKSITGESITVTALQQNIIIVFCVILIPAIILISGLVVWLRRKNL